MIIIIMLLAVVVADSWLLLGYETTTSTSCAEPTIACLLLQCMLHLVLLSSHSHLLNCFMALLRQFLKIVSLPSTLLQPE